MKILVIFAYFFTTFPSLSQENPLLYKNHVEPIKIQKLLRDNKCEEFYSYFGGSHESLFKKDWYLAMQLSLHGKCTKKDIPRYLDYMEKYPSTHYHYAKIGNLYYQGSEIPKNLLKAEQYFKHAIIKLYTGLIDLKIAMKTPDYPGTFNLWGQTYEEAFWSFSEGYFGPWDLPPPLIEKVKWLKKTMEGDGTELVEIANHLYNGTGGYMKDRTRAIRLLSSTSINFDLPKTHIDLAKWGIENKENYMVSEILYDPFLLPIELLEGAKKGDNRANDLITCFLETSKDTKKNLKQYIWALRREAIGEWKGNANSKKYEALLSPEDIRYGKRWKFEENNFRFDTLSSDFEGCLARNPL